MPLLQEFIADLDDEIAKLRQSDQYNKNPFLTMTPALARAFAKDLIDEIHADGRGKLSGIR